MAYSLMLKRKAINLRKNGFSLKDISKKLSIAKSTTSVWVNNLALDKQAQHKLKRRSLLKYYKTQLVRREKRLTQYKKYLKRADIIINNIEYNKEVCQVLCAVLYWCEGFKANNHYLRFTNSDPLIISSFIRLLSKGFNIDKTKFRALIHLHGYHNEKKQIQFWSKITNIPLSQFNRSYHKPNTKKRIRDNYQGCVAISYYDAKIAKQISAIYNTFAKHIGA